MWTPAALFLLLISVLFFTIFFYNDLQVLDIEDYLRAKKQVTVVPETAAMPQVVQELISEFKMIASDVENNVSEDWKQQNECKSRQSLERLYEQRKYAGGVSMKNHNWEKVFEEYSNLHSRCMKKIGNLTQYFHSQNNSISDCKFIITAAGNGLGNKVLFFISSVFYGILTKRVVLIPATTNIPAIMCEPFVGSSWKLDDNSVLTSKIWTKREDIIGAMDQAAKNSTRLTSHYAAVLTNDWQPDGRVYCSTGQELLKDVPWLKFGGCLYFLPKIFTIPEFRPLLEAMFPDKMALTYLLRSVMLPVCYSAVDLRGTGARLWCAASMVHQLRQE